MPSESMSMMMTDDDEEEEEDGNKLTLKGKKIVVIRLYSADLLVPYSHGVV